LRPILTEISTVEISDGNKNKIFEKYESSASFCTSNQVQNSKTRNSHALRSLRIFVENCTFLADMAKIGFFFKKVPKMGTFFTKIVWTSNEVSEASFDPNHLRKKSEIFSRTEFFVAARNFYIRNFYGVAGPYWYLFTHILVIF